MVVVVVVCSDVACLHCHLLLLLLSLCDMAATLRPHCHHCVLCITGTAVTWQDGGDDDAGW